MAERQAHLRHIELLIEEIEAELEALAERSAAMRALRQLDQREARGEPLTAVCGKALRAEIERQIAASPVAEGRRRLAELKALLIASQGACEPKATNIVVLADHRKGGQRGNTFVRAATRAAAASLILVTLAGAGLTLAPLGRAPMLDIGWVKPAIEARVAAWVAPSSF